MRSDRTIHCALNLSFDFVHFDKLLNFRLTSSKDVILGVKNGILLTTNLIKCCNYNDKSFIKKGSESRHFSDQNLWRGYRNLHPIPNPKSSNTRLISELWASTGVSNIGTAYY